MPIINLIHEIDHSVTINNGEQWMPPTNWDNYPGNPNEEHAVHQENRARAQLSKFFFFWNLPLRQFYGDKDVLRRDYDYKKDKPIEEE